MGSPTTKYKFHFSHSFGLECQKSGNMYLAWFAPKVYFIMGLVSET